MPRKKTIKSLNYSWIKPIKMSQYFYIASRLQRSDPLVLENWYGDIQMRPARREAPDQLWRWDKDCRLENKRSLVLEIKDGEKKEGTCLVANGKNDKLSQTWRVEQEAVRSTMNDLAVEADSNAAGSEVKMYKVRDSSYQKWILVPEDVWEDYEDMLKNPDPLTTAAFWKTLVDKYLHVVIGYSINNYKCGVDKAIETIEESAKHLDKVAEDTGIVNTVGGGASVAGGGMAIAGLVLAPFTGGLSLGLTVVGSLTSTAGGITSLTGSIINTVWEHKDAKKTRKAAAPFYRATLSLEALLNEYQKNVQEAAEFLATPVGQKMAIDAGNVVKRLNDARKIAMQVKSAVQVASSTWKHYKKAQDIKSLVKVIKFDFYKLTKATHALNAAAPQVKIPIVGKTLITAGSTSAKVLSSSMAVLGIGFGAWDIADGVKKIKEGSELGRELRKSAREFDKETRKLIDRYEESQKTNASKPND